MKKYEAPAMVKVAINPVEAYNSSSSACIIGEGIDVIYGTTCGDDQRTPWFSVGDYMCYYTLNDCE